MKRIILAAVCGATAFLTACTAGAPSVETVPFGRLSSGEEVTLYRLRNGAIADIVPGYDDIRDFETGSERFFGALIGRYGNRIANASFPLDGDTVRLTANECLAGCPGHLHGGEKGFDRMMWQAEPLVEADRAGVRFTRLSPDGEEGYPGNLACTVTYWFTKDNVWRAEYEAATDRPTIVNLSNHTYFNLKGVDDGGYVMDHVMQVEADRYLPNDARVVPLNPWRVRPSTCGSLTAWIMPSTPPTNTCARCADFRSAGCSAARRANWPGPPISGSRAAAAGSNSGPRNPAC